MLRLIKDLATLAVLALLGWGGWLMARNFWADPGAPAHVNAQLGATRVRYDSAYARDAAGRAGGQLTALDLAAQLPNFAPAGVDAARVPPTQIVFLRITPQDDATPPEDRMAKLYVRFLEGDQWTSPGGLVMRRFQTDSPFDKEELYYAPPEGRLFLARCTRPRQPPDGLGETCLSDFRAHGLDVQLRFAPETLSDWERIMSGARGLIELMAR